MRSNICQSCHQVLQSRLRQRICSLQKRRQEYHPSPSRHAQAPQPALKSWYWDTNPPDPAQLDAAAYFFRTHRPHKQWTASEWRQQNDDPHGILVPEIAFLGRSNVGKSSLLNALLEAPGLNKVGPRPGKTQVMHAWALSARDPRTGGAVKGMNAEMDTKLTLLDAPGYGFGSRDDWGQEIIKYLSRRKQLRRIFVMIDVLHGVKSSDQMMVKLLCEHNISHQVIACKCDRLQPLNKQQELLQGALEQLKDFVQPAGKGYNHGAVGLGEILAVSCGEDDSEKAASRFQGVANLQWAVLRATGLDDFAVRQYKTRVPQQASIDRLIEAAVPGIANPSMQRTLPTGAVRSELPNSILKRPTNLDDWNLPDWLFDDLPPKSPATGAYAVADGVAKGRVADRQSSLAPLGAESVAGASWPPLPPLRSRKSPSATLDSLFGRPFAREPAPLRQPANTNYAAPSRQFDPLQPPSSSQTSSPQAIFTSTSKGSVGRGIDDLLAMTGATSKSQSKQPQRQQPKSQSQRGSKSRRSSSTQDRARSLTASNPASLPSQKLPTGPGVTRGLEALLALTGADDKSRPGKKRRRNR